MSDAVTDSNPQSFLDTQDLAVNPSKAVEEQAIEEQAVEEQFLRLHLVPDTTVLLPVNQLTEVLNIAVNQIVPIPHMPAWTMGIYNWRGEILWIVDLGHLCGLTPWYQWKTNTSTHSVVVLQVHDVNTVSTEIKTLGLIVNRVEDIEWCDPNLIQPLPASPITSELSKFLQGCWWKANDELVAVLEGKAIVAAMPQVNS